VLPAVLLNSASLQAERDAELLRDLDAQQLTAVLSLSDAFAPDGPTPDGIIRTNCIPLTRGDECKEESSRGLFALTCRLNHSCAGASNARSFFPCFDTCGEIERVSRLFWYSFRRNSLVIKQNLCSHFVNASAQIRVER